MRMQGNTIFITGGTSGIGRGLAEAFHKRGNQVIISGRRQQRLDEICAAHPGMRATALDVTDANAIQVMARRIIADFPEINIVFNNAGIQRQYDFARETDFDDAAITQEVNTNVLGPIRIAAAFMPHLTAQPAATLINVSSGLAFVPLARFPVYCATKAAIHSWTLSLRHQLRNSSVRVIELIPPYVSTELGGPGKPPPGTTSMSPMPLDAFIDETMAALESDADEIAISGAKKLVAATCLDTVKNVFAAMNH